MLKPGPRSSASLVQCSVIMMILISRPLDNVPIDLSSYISGGLHKVRLVFINLELLGFPMECQEGHKADTGMK